MNINALFGTPRMHALPQPLIGRHAPGSGRYWPLFWPPDRRCLLAAMPR